MKKRKTSKTRSIVALAIVLVLTIAIGVIGVTGMPLDSRGLYRLKNWLPTTDTENWPSALSLGLDLRGGVYVEYTAEIPEGSTIDATFDTLRESTIAVIQQRLSDKGYTEATVQAIGTNGIRVEIPDVSDPSDVLDLIGSSANLEFKTPDGETFMTGADVQTASYLYSEGDHQVAFTLTSEGATKFAEVTAANIGNTISIYLDGEELISPTVQSAITGGSGVINGMGSQARAETIAAQIQSGALPLTLTQDKVDTVSATLGDDALSSAVKAAIIGILLIMLLMIIRYRLNGVAASWALCVYIILLFLLLAVIPGIQLTLPGLAGIVLGIGMAVDANVIIFERFNEELRAGRPLKACVRAGFKNAMSAILDANVTTAIAGIVLLVYGTGTVQGFAKTLLLGVVVSMFTAIVVTRFLMTRIVAVTGNNTGLFASVKAEKEVQ